MAKPTIVTRAGKGSALTWTEGDTNLTNLQNATISVTDGTNTAVLDLNDTLTLTAGTNITLSVNPTTDTVTINSTASGGMTDIVSDTTPQLGGNLDVNGYSIVSASNGNISIVPHGSGNIQLTPASGYVTISAVNFPTSTPSAGQVLYAINGSGSLGWTTPSSGGATTLDELSDVVITAAASGDILYHNGTNWVDTAASSITVGTASVGSTVTLTADNTTNATNYPLFANAATGNLSPRTDTGFTYNPSTGTLTSTAFSGSLSGNASSATYASAVTLTADNTTNAVNYPLFTNAATGNLSPRTDTGFTYNPSTGILTATGFAGALNGTVGATTASTGAFTTLSASSTVSGTGFSTYLASPPAIGGTAAAAGAFTTLSASSTVSGTGFSTYLASPPAIGSTTASTGKFTSLEFKNPIEPIFAITAGSGATTLAPDCANGSVQSFNMSTATSLTFNGFTNATAGQSLTIIVTNNTISTITSTMKWAGGVKTLTGTASAIDIISVYYDGTNYYASISKGFA